MLITNLIRVTYLARSLLSQEFTKRIPLRIQTHSLDSSRDTLLSQDVAVSLLQENKMALKRCELVRRLIQRNENQQTVLFPPFWVGVIP